MYMYMYMLPLATSWSLYCDRHALLRHGCLRRAQHVASACSPGWSAHHAAVGRVVGDSSPSLLVCGVVTCSCMIIHQIHIWCTLWTITLKTCLSAEFTPTAGIREPVVRLLPYFMEVIGRCPSGTSVSLLYVVQVAGKWWVRAATTKSWHCLMTHDHPSGIR